LKDKTENIPEEWMKHLWKKLKQLGDEGKQFIKGLLGMKILNQL